MQYCPKSQHFFSLQQFDDIVGDKLGEEMSGVSFDWISFRVNEKLFKIPRDVSSGDRPPNYATRITHQRNRVIAE